jgi:hypothetical protein
MLTKAQITAGLQQAALPQPAAAPVAAPAVSVFAKAKNLLNSAAVNLKTSRTAKLAIGSIVAAAIVVYAGIKFGTSTAKKAEEKKNEQKTTDRVIAKMQEARAAAGKAVTLLSARAKQFKEKHPTAVKVIGAAVVAGGVFGVAKLLYKPAAQPSSVANAQPNDLCYQGDVIDFDGPNPDYARGTMHEETYGSVEDTTDTFELDANQLAVRAKFKNDVFYNTASTRKELAECMEKFNRENGQTISTPVSDPVVSKAPKSVDQWLEQAAERAKNGVGVSFDTEKVKQQADDELDNMGREWTQRLDRHDRLSMLDRFFGLPKGGYQARLEAQEAAANRKIEEKANALWKDYAPDFTDNEGLNEMLNAQEQAAQEFQKASDKSFLNRFLGRDLDAQIAAEKVAFNEA